MARIEGTGIKEASKDSKKVAQVYYGGPEAENKRRVKSFLKEFQEKSPLSGGPGGTIKIPDMVPIKKASADEDETFERRDFFSMKTDPRNEVKVATAGDFSGTFNESDFQGYVKQLEIKNFKGLPSTMQRMLRENYLDDVQDGRYKEGQLINQAPVKEKPSFMDQTKNFAGSIFNTLTGTQGVQASQIGGPLPNQNQFSSGDTSFSSYVRGGGEGQQRGIVSPTSTPAPKQTVASLPSDYKQTEAKEFAKTETYQRAKKNPNFTVGVDSKGQPRVTAVQKTRDEAGSSARTAQGNQARVQQNAKARAQAAAYNRKISGTKPKTAKERAQDAAKARKAAGPNRKMSAGQVTRSQAGASARTAQGNRARVKSNARKRAQAAAKARKARKKKSKKGKK